MKLTKEEWHEVEKFVTPPIVRKLKALAASPGDDERMTADDWGVIGRAVETLTLWSKQHFTNGEGASPMWNPTLRRLRNLYAKRAALATPPTAPVRDGTMDDEARIPQPVMPDGKTRAQLWPVSLYGQQQFASAICYDPQRDAAVERLSEENAELKGIIAGLNDVREGRVKPLAQIHEELRESHD